MLRSHHAQKLHRGEQCQTSVAVGRREVDTARGRALDGDQRPCLARTEVEPRIDVLIEGFEAELAMDPSRGGLAEEAAELVVDALHRRADVAQAGIDVERIECLVAVEESLEAFARRIAAGGQQDAQQVLLTRDVPQMPLEAGGYPLRFLARRAERCARRGRRLFGEALLAHLGQECRKFRISVVFGGSGPAGFFLQAVERVASQGLEERFELGIRRKALSTSLLRDG
ncbi:MAG: hypothetical protein ABR587_06180 [Candidatus Binatia bacterium]